MGGGLWELKPDYVRMRATQLDLMISEANENSDLIRTETGRNLQLFTVARSQFGVFQDQIATIAEWREPTPLPHAPDAILGVIGVEGRMLTMLDLARIPGIDVSANTLLRRKAPQVIVALRGDEQLALAADVPGETIEIGEISRSQESNSGLILSIVKHGKDEISILNLKQLFACAIQGRERRRRRF